MFPRRPQWCLCAALRVLPDSCCIILNSYIHFNALLFCMCTFLWNEACKSKRSTEIIIFIRKQMFSIHNREWVRMLTGKCCLDKVNIERVTFYQVRHSHYSSTAEIMQSMWQFYAICKVIMKNRHYLSLNWRVWTDQIKCAYLGKTTDVDLKATQKLLSRRIEDVIP